MKIQITRKQASTWQICSTISVCKSTRPRRLYLVPVLSGRSRDFTTTCAHLEKSPQISVKSEHRYTRQREQGPVKIYDKTTACSLDTKGQSRNEEDIEGIVATSDMILSSSSIPSEQEIEAILTRCENIANNLLLPFAQPLGNKRSAATALLSVNDPAPTTPALKPRKFSSNVQKYFDKLSKVAYLTLLHPPVFITPNVLERYVSLHSRLRKPETLPEIFELYSTKEIPIDGSSPIRYRTQWPDKIANAIKGTVADQALQIAIDTKRLAVAMGIIESTYAKKAFRRDKFIRKGLVPALGLALAPPAIHAVASQLATYQTSMDSTMATNMAFAGLLAYVGFTSTIGLVAIATANDQMDRVTWAPGMSLRQRWIREEERAAIDKVAGAWGFREKWRRGEEEGEEWDALREWIGHKGMILDRVELMEGME